MEHAEIERICEEYFKDFSYADAGRVMDVDNPEPHEILDAMEKLAVRRLEADKAIARAYAKEKGMRRERVKKLLKNVERDNHGASVLGKLHCRFPVTVGELEKTISHALTTLSQQKVRKEVGGVFIHSENNSRALKKLAKTLSEIDEKDLAVVIPPKELIPIVNYAVEIGGMKHFVRLGLNNSEELMRARAHGVWFVNSLLQQKAEFWRRRN